MPRSIPALLAALAVIALPVLAQPMEGPRPRMPMKPDYARALDVSAEKAAQIEAVMQREREQMRKVREGTRAELVKILTPEQLRNLEELMRPGPPRGMRPDHPGGILPGPPPGGPPPR